LSFTDILNVNHLLEVGILPERDAADPSGRADRFDTAFEIDRLDAAPCVSFFTGL
jgi:hypothetical protein